MPDKFVLIDPASDRSGNNSCNTPSCWPKTPGHRLINEPWTDGSISTPEGDVPRVRTTLLPSDRLGTFKVRSGIGRMNYKVGPGLYAVGSPAADSPVLVSANYKLSFDRLRSELYGLDLWILVLDTKGINVWCAAGKGTFGTSEIIRQVHDTGLERIVSHRTLVLPQLGAPGTNAHEVRKASGFRVVYGPVRASDIRSFIDLGMKATADMRLVKFDISDRAELIPMEVAMWLKLALAISAGFYLLGGFGPDGYSLGNANTTGLGSALLFLFAFVGVGTLGPLLLPWLPGRAFAVKGAWLGLALAAALQVYMWTGHGPFDNRLSTASWALIVPTVSSFVLMNFTGASTYTSLSGVRREMRYAVPVQIAGILLGSCLWVGGLVI
jgi:hypothetical protein